MFSALNVVTILWIRGDKENFIIQGTRWVGKNTHFCCCPCTFYIDKAIILNKVTQLMLSYCFSLSASCSRNARRSDRTTWSWWSRKSLWATFTLSVKLLSSFDLQEAEYLKLEWAHYFKSKLLTYAYWSARTAVLWNFSSRNQASEFKVVCPFDWIELAYVKTVFYTTAKADKLKMIHHWIVKWRFINVRLWLRLKKVTTSKSFDK